MSPLTHLLCCCCRCFSPQPTNSPDDAQAIRSLSQSPPQHTMPRKHPTTTAAAEAYVPSWERRRAPSTSSSSSTTLSPDAPRATGLRARGASMSSSPGAAPPPESRQRWPSSASHLPPQPADEAAAGTGNSMLYFGNGVTPQHAMRTYTAGPPPRGSGGYDSGRTAGGRSSGGGKKGVGGNASGRDASGYAPSGVGGGAAQSGLAGMYSSLTYGGSTQYNFAGTQSYGAGTGVGGGLGGGLM